MAPDDTKLFIIIIIIIIIACGVALVLLVGLVFYGPTGWLGP